MTGEHDGTASNRPSAILWICRGDEGYGVASAIESFSTALERVGWRIGLVSLADGQLNERFRTRGWVEAQARRRAGAGSVTGGLRGRVDGLVELSAAKRAVLRASERVVERLDAPVRVVESFNHALLDLLGTVAEALGARAVWRTATGIPEGRTGALRRVWIGHQCRRHGIAVLATSAWVARSLRGTVSVDTIHHGIDGAPFRVASGATARDIARSGLGIAPHERVFVVAARLYPSDEKGQLALARALGANARARGTHLVLAGGPVDSVYAAELRALDDPEGLRVTLVGERRDVAPILALADVVANPRRGVEPFGLSIVEAMFAARPVLAGALGGPSETLVDGKTGWLFEPGVAHALDRALDRVFADEPRWQELGCAAQARAASRYDIEVEREAWLRHVTDRSA